MQELALHLLDIGENAIRAHAGLLTIDITESGADDALYITIEDNGTGMTQTQAEQALDPFYTTRGSARVGLGLALLDQAARRAGGSLQLRSSPAAGTRVTACFVHSHIDRQPLGDVAGALIALLLNGPGLDIVYQHRVDAHTYVLDTRSMRRHLGDVPLTTPAVLSWLRDHISQGISDVGSSA